MDTPELFHAKVFLLLWLPMSMFASIIVYDRARRRGMDAQRWGLLTLAMGLGGVLAYAIARKSHPKPLADRRAAGIAEDVAAGSARAPEVIDEEKHRRPTLDEAIEERHRQKMTYFYATIMMLPLLAFALGDGVVASAEAANFALFSVVFFLIVFFLRDEFTKLPLVPRQWEVIFGAAVAGLAFALVPFKPLLEALAGSIGTRPFGLLNYSVLLIGVLLAFFGVSNFRIPLMKAITLFGGLGLVAIGLLRFSLSLAVFAALLFGVAKLLYGVHRLPPIYMPGLVVAILVLINSGFYNNPAIQDVATTNLGEFVARFSTGLSTLLGLPAGACASCANLPVYSGRQWDIIFTGTGIPGGSTAVSIVGNCTGIVGAMFYGFIASVILLWVRAEWWRKAAVLAGGVVGSFITNLFRISVLLGVYWEYDYPARITYQSNLLYVHEHIGDVMYIGFILVYWVFVFRFILPRGGLKGPDEPARGGDAPVRAAPGPVPAPAKRRKPVAGQLLPNGGQGGSRAKGQG
jgi:exosortase/archaeosortase family protein